MDKLEPMKSLHSRIFILLLSVGSVSGIILTLVSSVKYKPYGVHDLMRPQWDAIQLQVAATADAAQAAAIAKRELESRLPGTDVDVPIVVPRPMAVTDEIEHDFGTLDPGAQSSYTFTIRNEGTLPLIVTAADTSCKCTVSKASKDVVQPGDHAEVTLTWNTGTSRKFYRQYALVKTNDPERREIEFAVNGQIKTHVGFDVEGALTAKIDPGTTASATWIVFSQTLSRFSIDAIECQLPGFRYSTEAIHDDELKSLHATYGLRVRAQTDALMDSGQFNETVRVSVRPIDLSESATGDGSEATDRVDDSPVYRELSFQINVAAPISFYGADLHKDHGLDLGTILQGNEKTTRIMIRVRDKTPPVTMVVKSISPSVLQASVEAVDDKPGNYKLTIKVPENAPQTFFNVDGSLGMIEVADPDRPYFAASFPISGKVLAVTKK